MVNVNYENDQILLHCSIMEAVNRNIKLIKVYFSSFLMFMFKTTSHRLKNNNF